MATRHSPVGPIAMPREHQRRPGSIMRPHPNETLDGPYLVPTTFAETVTVHPRHDSALQSRPSIRISAPGLGTYHTNSSSQHHNLSFRQTATHDQAKSGQAVRSRPFEQPGPPSRYQVASGQTQRQLDEVIVSPGPHVSGNAAQARRRHFRYQDIDENRGHIRLLRLLSDPDKRAPIRCETDFACFSDEESDCISKSYEAVSYYWGNGPRDHAIEVDGTTLLVSYVVDDILRHLRLRTEDRLLWLDVICINQANHPEKSSQIRLMRQIFRGATRVLCSLGHHCGPGNTSYHSMVGVVFRCIQERTAMSEKLQILLLRFFQIPWFHRVWVVQEVAVAQRLVLFCGPHSLDGVYFGKLSNKIRASSWLDEGLQRLTPFLDYLGGSWEPNKLPELLQLLHWFRSWEASNPVDKIYAMLGLAVDGRSLLRPERGLLRRDRKLDEIELYKKVARYMLTRYNSLDVLAYTLQIGTSNMPSWCPDWRLPAAVAFRPVLPKGRLREAPDVYTIMNDTISVRGHVLGTMRGRGVELELDTAHHDVGVLERAMISGYLQQLATSTGSIQIRPGDLCCVLEGATGLALLRPANPDFTLLFLDHSHFSPLKASYPVPCIGLTAHGRLIVSCYTNRPSIKQTAFHLK